MKSFSMIIVALAGTLLLSGCADEKSALYLQQSAQHAMDGRLFEAEQWRERAEKEGASPERIVASAQPQEAYHELQQHIYLNHTTDAIISAERVMNQTFGDRELAERATGYYHGLKKAEKEFRSYDGAYAFKEGDDSDYGPDYSGATLTVKTKPNRKAVLTLSGVKDFDGRTLSDSVYHARFDANGRYVLYIYESSIEFLLNGKNEIRVRNAATMLEVDTTFERTSDII